MIKTHRPAPRKHTPILSDLKLASNGRWKGILVSVGIPGEHLDGRGHPCPKCGGRDRFAALPDIDQRGAVHCRHCFTSNCDPAPSDGLSTLRWALNCDFNTACRWLVDWINLPGVKTETIKEDRNNDGVFTQPEPRQNPQLSQLAEECVRAMPADWYDRLGLHLGLKADSLQALDVGYLSGQNATTWPMRNGSDSIVGIRLRGFESNKKWSVRGSRAGLFLPVDVRRWLRESDTLFICEGPTDTAALHGIGLEAIGLPSACGGLQSLQTLLASMNPQQIVVVADRDEAGMQSARRVIRSVTAFGDRTRVIQPPIGINDAREWVGQGATSIDVFNAVIRTPWLPRRIDR